MRKVVQHNEISEILPDEIDYENSIVVLIFRNNINILRSVWKNNNKLWYFTQLTRPGDVNSCTDSPILTINANLKYKENQIYVFDSVQELAAAIIENGWT